MRHRRNKVEPEVKKIKPKGRWVVGTDRMSARLDREIALSIIYMRCWRFKQK